MDSTEFITWQSLYLAMAPLASLPNYGYTRPSTATTTQQYQQHHHTYESEEEEENEGREFYAPAGVAPSAAVQIPWRPAVPRGVADVHGAQRTAAGMHSNAREATSHDQEERPYGDLLHVLRYLVSGSPTPLADHLIAQFVDVMRRECRCVVAHCSRWPPLLRLD